MWIRGLVLIALLFAAPDVHAQFLPTPGTSTTGGGGGSGTVTSISTTAPITGGVITTSGTIACATCVTSASSLTSGSLLKGSGGQGIQTADLTGDVTTSGAVATTIAAQAVTNAKLANVATATFKGRTTAGTGSPEDMTATQATALLNQFTTSLKGLVSASGGGTTNFLRADNTWAAPPGSGGTVTSIATTSPITGGTITTTGTIACATCTTSAGLTTGVVPVASGTHAIVDSILTQIATATITAGIAFTPPTLAGIPGAPPDFAIGNNYGSHTDDIDHYSTMWSTAGNLSNFAGSTLAFTRSAGTLASPTAFTEGQTPYGLFSIDTWTLIGTSPTWTNVSGIVSYVGAIANSGPSISGDVNVYVAAYRETSPGVFDQEYLQWDFDAGNGYFGPSNFNQSGPTPPFFEVSLGLINGSFNFPWGGLFVDLGTRAPGTENMRVVLKNLTTSTPVATLGLDSSDNVVKKTGLLVGTADATVVGHYLSSTTTPAVSNTSANSCGTTAATIVGTDVSGRITVGATAGTSCTVTFTTAFANTPICLAANETTGNLMRPTPTLSTLVIAGTMVAGDKLAYICLGRV